MREGCRSLRRAWASIWRTRSRETPHDRSNLLKGEHPAGTSHGYPDANFCAGALRASLELGYGNFVWILHRATHALNIAPYRPEIKIWSPLIEKPPQIARSSSPSGCPTEGRGRPVVRAPVPSGPGTCRLRRATRKVFRSQAFATDNDFGHQNGALEETALAGSRYFPQGPAFGSTEAWANSTASVISPNSRGSMEKAPSIESSSRSRAKCFSMTRAPRTVAAIATAWPNE